MSTFKINPVIDTVDQTIGFPTDQINQLNRQRYADTFGTYQANFRPYAYMKLNKDMKYVIHQVTGRPFVWRKSNSCGWDPSGAVRVGQNEVNTCRIELNLEHCWDENIDSCFAYFNTWTEGGDVSDDLDANGAQLIDHVISTVLANASLGKRSLLVAGQFHNFSAVDFADNTPLNIREDIVKQYSACAGWLSRVNALSATHAHLNLDSLIDTSDVDGKRWEGDPLDLFDEILEAAPNQLVSLVDEGGIPAIENQDGSPVVLVTPSVYKTIASKWVATTNAFATGGFKPRISMEMLSAGEAGRQYKQYYIDGIPVIPLKEVGEVDAYLTGATHGMYVTAAGNIQLGTSYGSLPVAETENIAVQIQKSPLLRDKGKVEFYAAALAAAAIADTDYIAGAVKYVQPV